MPKRPLSLNPPTVRTPFNGPEHTLVEMVRLAQGVRGEQSMLVRGQVEEIVRGLQPKDYMSEILAIRYWAMGHIRYLNDPLHVELIKDPQRICEEVIAYGASVADCDEIACCLGAMALCLGRVCEFVAAGFKQPGSYSHVFIRVMEPRSHQWIVLDPVAGTAERGMIRKVSTFKFASLDEAPEKAA
jgi:hypothetical protein